MKTGFGLTVLADRLVQHELRRLGPADGLPKLADVVVGVYLSKALGSTAAQSVAARLSTLFVEGDVNTKGAA
jgi:hypothetical protein